MEFILNEYHRNISDQELLDDLKSVANQLNKQTLSCREYLQYGKYGYNSFRRHFGGWNKALILCGMEPNIYQISAEKSKPLYHCISDEDLLTDVLAVASKLDKETISGMEYTRNGNYSNATCRKRFGSWENTLLRAGLKPFIQVSSKRIEDELLLEDIERMWIQLGRQPTISDIKNGYSQYSPNAFIRHFGSWRSALESFVEWVNGEKVISQVIPIKKKCLDTNQATTNPTAKDLHSTSREISLRLRFKVMARDNFKCCLCGASPAKDPSVELHIDHIVPWSKGGETTFENLQTLCSKCNLGKGNLSG